MSKNKINKNTSFYYRPKETYTLIKIFIIGKYFEICEII